MQTLVPAALRRRVLHGLRSLLPGSNRQPSRYRRAALVQLRQGGRAGTPRMRTPERSSGGPSRASCARRDSNPQHPASRAGLSGTLEYEHVEPSSGADPDLAYYESAVTAVCDGSAAGQRLELRSSASEAAVLPLDDPAPGAEGASRTHIPRGLSSRGLPVAVTPAWCAAPASNRDPRIKSPLHVHLCLQRA
jgi:hypothetical protein